VVAQSTSPLRLAQSEKAEELFFDEQMILIAKAKGG
jgi:hypothetical protein